MVIPTSYGFDDDTLYLHGSVASRSLQARSAHEAGQVACVTITLVDGLVLARSVFEHAVNYRSAMIYGTPVPVTDAAEKLHGLRCLSEHLAPGQWDGASQYPIQRCQRVLPFRPTSGREQAPAPSTRQPSLPLLARRPRPAPAAFPRPAAAARSTHR